MTGQFCLQRNPPTCVTSTEHPTTENWDALMRPEAVTISVVTPLPDTFATTVVEVPGWAGSATTLPHTGADTAIMLTVGIALLMIGIAMLRKAAKLMNKGAMK